MRLLSFILSLAFTISALADEGPKPDFSKQVIEDAAEVKKLLGDSWVVEAKGNVMLLTSKFEVFLANVVSRFDDMPQFSDSETRENLLKESKPGKYEIRLRYEPRMRPEKYEEVRQIRAQLRKANTKTKEGWHKIQQDYLKAALPRYRVFPDCDVYLDELMRPGSALRFFPPKSVKEIGAARAILDELFANARSWQDGG